MKSISLTAFLICTVHLIYAQPACSTPQHSEFDFWLGNWEVRLQDGTLAGQNTITKEAGNCVLRESWESAKGDFTGSSLNFYDPETDRWEQLWVDSSGTVLRLQGAMKEGSMILQSPPAKNAEGKLIVNRISWTPLEDGRVRQLWEILENEQVKQVAFDGYYRKME